MNSYKYLFCLERIVIFKVLLLFFLHSTFTGFLNSVTFIRILSSKRGRRDLYDC